MTDSTPVHTQFELFSKLVSTWCPGYKHALRSWIAVRHPQETSEWQLLSAELIFEAADTTRSSRPFIIKTKSLWAGVEIIDVNPADTRELLRAIKLEPLAFKTQAGELVLRSLRTNFSIKSAADVVNERSHDARHSFYPLGRLPLLDERRQISLQISKSQFGNPTIPDRALLELELLSAESPLNGMGDLLSRLGKPDAVIQGFQTPTIDIIAFAPAYLQKDSELRDGTGRIRISAPPTLDRDLFSVGLICIGKQGPSYSLAIGKDELLWNSVDGRSVGTATLHNVDTPTLVAVLRYDGEYLDRLSIVDASRTLNDLYEIHRAIDTSDHLLALLGSSDANAFERGVALLLGNLGLSTLHYGDIPEFSDGPDCYAISSQSDLYVVECTTGHPDHKGKLQKVHNRAERIRDLVQRRGLMFKNIQPMLVTTMPRANTFEISAQASDLGIALLCREDLQHLHHLVLTAPVPMAEEFQAHVLALVPRRIPNISGENS